jgi:ABC-type hemin transport system ATPase subunit
MSFTKPAVRTPSTTAEVAIYALTPSAGGAISGYAERTVLDATGGEMDRQRVPLATLVAAGILTAAERNQMKAILDKIRAASDLNLTQS